MEPENKGHKPKYLTVERFQQFLNNDWKHLSKTVYWIIIPLLMAIFAAVLAKFITG